MIAPIKRLAVLIAAIGALAAFPGMASAASCTDTLVDTAGYSWDLSARGTVGDGSHAGLGLSDAFDTFGSVYLSVNGGTSFLEYSNADANACTLAQDGREIVYPANTTIAPGISVSRQVYVPSTGTAALRYVHTLTNTGASSQTFLYRFGGNFGSDSSTTVAATSSGDTVLDTADSWASTFEDSSSSTDPRVTNAWDGTSQPIQRASKAGRFDPSQAGYTEETDSDYLGAEYSVTLAPGETKRFMHLVAMRHTADEQTAAAATLASESDEFRAGLSEADEDNIQNWVFDQDHDSVKNRADNCATDANTGQENLDGDAKGDACDEDIDGDGLTNPVETALRTDSRKADTDGDGTNDSTDSCPTLAAATADGCPAPVALPEQPNVDKTAPLASILAAKKVSLKALLKKGIVVKLGSNEPAAFELEMLAQAKSARLAQVGDLIVSAKRVGLGGGQRSVKLTVAKKFRKALRTKSRLRLKVVATDAAGNRTVTASGIKLAR